MQHWLVKQEPEKYPWVQFVKDKGTLWDGVRNYQARNNLRAMRKGDLVLFYHSVSEKGGGGRGEGDARGVSRIPQQRRATGAWWT